MGFVEPANTASARVLTKIGMAYQRGAVWLAAAGRALRPTRRRHRLRRRPWTRAQTPSKRQRRK